MNTWTKTNYGKKHHETVHKDEKSFEIPIVCEKKNMMQIRQGLQKHLGRRKKTMSSKN